MIGQLWVRVEQGTGQARDDEEEDLRPQILRVRGEPPHLALFEPLPPFPPSWEFCVSKSLFRRRQLRGFLSSPPSHPRAKGTRLDLGGRGLRASDLSEICPYPLFQTSTQGSSCLAEAIRVCILTRPVCFLIDYFVGTMTCATLC